MKLYQIKVSDIIQQVERGDAFLEYVWPWDTVPNPAHVLGFREPTAYANDDPFGWFWMRVWITMDGRHGFLRDSHCPFELVRDVPLQLLWDELQEIYTMAKLTDDPLIVGHSARQYYPVRMARRLNLVYDVRYPELGYESKKRDTLESYERRLQ